MDDPQLDELQRTLEAEMPITRAMGITAVSWNNQRLAMRMPLGPTRNHQTSAFAGSLNALCTISGWGTLFMLMQQAGLRIELPIFVRFFREFVGHLLQPMLRF